VYRREDLLPWSHSVDRHLKELTVDGTLQKLRTGLYYSPRKFEFGEAPADEHELVKAFLKTDRFVVTSPNAYNQLGLGTTQLYNKRVVYNQKRHGTFPLGNRMVTFERRFNVPRQLSPEFLPVDLVMSWVILRRIGTPFFLAFAKKRKRWIRESFHGQFLSTANTPRRKSFRRCCTMPPA
jgi:hypothetical protein